MPLIKDLFVWGFSVFNFMGNTITDLYNSIIAHECIDIGTNIILDVIETKKLNISKILKYNLFKDVVDKYIFYSSILIISWVLHNYFYINYNIYINSLLLITCIEPIKLKIIKSDIFSILYSNIKSKINNLINHIFYKVLKYFASKSIINYLNINIEIDINDLKKIKKTEIIDFIKTVLKYFLVKWIGTNNNYAIQYTLGLVYKYNTNYLDYSNKKNYIIDLLRKKKYSELGSIYSLDAISDIIVYTKNDNDIFSKIKEKLDFDTIRFFSLWTLSYKIWLIPVIFNSIIDIIMFHNNKHVIYNLIGLILGYNNSEIIGSIICIWGDNIFFYVKQIIKDIKIPEQVLKNYQKIIFEYLWWIFVMKCFNVGFLAFWLFESRNDILIIGLLGYTSSYNLQHLLSMAFINSCYKITILWLDIKEPTLEPILEPISEPILEPIIESISEPVIEPINNDFVEIEPSEKIKEMELNEIIENNECSTKIDKFIKIDEFF